MFPNQTHTVLLYTDRPYDSPGTGAEALEVRCKVLACLDKIEGAVRKTGKAPAANLERQLGDFLRGMMT